MYKNEQAALGNTITSKDVESTTGSSSQRTEIDSDDEMWAEETRYYKELQNQETTNINQEEE